MGVHLLTHTFLFWSYIKMDPYQNPNYKHCKTSIRSSQALYLLPVSGCKCPGQWPWPLWTALGVSALIEWCKKRCLGRWRDSMQLLEWLPCVFFGRWHAFVGLCRHVNDSWCMYLYGRQQTLQPPAGCMNSFCTLLRIFHNANIYLI